MPLLNEIVNLTPEQRLMLYALQASVQAKDPNIAMDKIAGDTARLHWDHFWHDVQQHGVQSMIMHAVKKGYIFPIPHHQHFPEITQKMFIRNSLLTRTLLLLLQKLETEGVDVIPFKGPILSLRVYGNLTQRSFCDLDLLVSQADFERTKNFFFQQGYDLNIDGDWSVHLIHPDTDVNIDLHHQISENYFPFRLDYSKLLQRSEDYQYANQTMQVLSPEDMLVILCVQLAKDAHHQQKFLKKACDLALLIDRIDLRWKDAIAYAESMHGKRLVLFSLHLVNQLLTVDLPSWINQEIQQDTILMAYSQSVCQKLFTEDTFQRGKRGMLLRALFLLEDPFEINKNKKDLIQHILTTTAARFRPIKTEKDKPIENI